MNYFTIKDESGLIRCIKIATILSLSFDEKKELALFTLAGGGTTQEITARYILMDTDEVGNRFISKWFSSEGDTYTDHQGIKHTIKFLPAYSYRKAITVLTFKG